MINYKKVVVVKFEMHTDSMDEQSTFAVNSFYCISSNDNTLYAKKITIASVGQLIL